MRLPRAKSSFIGLVGIALTAGSFIGGIKFHQSVKFNKLFDERNASREEATLSIQLQDENRSGYVLKGKGICIEYKSNIGDAERDAYLCYVREPQ